MLMQCDAAMLAGNNAVDQKREKKQEISPPCSLMPCHAMPYQILLSAVNLTNTHMKNADPVTENKITQKLKQKD